MEGHETWPGSLLVQPLAPRRVPRRDGRRERYDGDGGSETRIEVARAGLTAVSGRGWQASGREGWQPAIGPGQLSRLGGRAT